MLFKSMLAYSNMMLKDTIMNMRYSSNKAFLLLFSYPVCTAMQGIRYSGYSAKLSILSHLNNISTIWVIVEGAEKYMSQKKDKTLHNVHAYTHTHTTTR